MEDIIENTMPPWRGNQGLTYFQKKTIVTEINLQEFYKKLGIILWMREEDTLIM